MSGLAARRCSRHDLREAVCRCPGCTLFFCRECVTEHDGRLLCPACLAKGSASQSTKAGGITRRALEWTAPLAGLALAWILFYYAGWIVSRFPAQVHTQERVR